MGAGLLVMNSSVVTQAVVSNLDQDFSYLSGDLSAHASQTLAAAHGGRFNSSTPPSHGTNIGDPSAIGPGTFVPGYVDGGGKTVGSSVVEFTSLDASGRMRVFSMPSATASTGPT